MREFRILGPLEVVVDDRPVRLGGPKQRAALAILLLNVNRVVSVERLADALYAGAPPVTAVTQVQRQISDLRRLLGAEAIKTRVPGTSGRSRSTSYAVRSSSGVARRSPTSHTSRSRNLRSRGSKSSVWPRPNSASMPSSSSAATRGSWPRSRHLSWITRFASGRERF